MGCGKTCTERMPRGGAAEAISQNLFAKKE
jgi:hypothetical protein